MGYDVYCAICGTAFSALPWEDNEDDYKYDESLLSRHDLDWLYSASILTENPKSSSLTKVFLSGPAREDDHGMFIYEPGTGPGGPVDEHETGESTTITYNESGDNPFAVPFHTNCLVLLRHYLAPDKVDNELLYETVRSIGPNDHENCLRLDYGPVQELQEQYWLVKKGTEYVLSPFLDIQRLNQFYNGLGDKVATSPVSSIITASSSPASDLFVLLPAELILLILSHLDMSDIYHARRASRSIAQIQLKHSYWQSRISADMPWLFDFPDSSSIPNQDNLDWTNIYRSLMRQSDPQYRDHIGGLANRRRIWAMCEQISEVYMSRKQFASVFESTNTILEDAISTPTVQVNSPERHDYSLVKISLLDEYHDLIHKHLVLSVFWTADGELSGFGVQESGMMSPSPLRDDVSIPLDDWITGVVVCSESKLTGNASKIPRFVHGLRVLYAKRSEVHLRKVNGDQRLIQATTGHVVVGFLYHISKGDRLVKLALLQQPNVKLPYGAEQRVKDKTAGSISPQAAEYMWRNQIPALPLFASKIDHGYWSVDVCTDALSMESIVLGQSEDELADLIAIGVDVHFGGYEVRYGNRPTRFAGPRRHAMQFLQIDGRGGERISCMYWSVHHIPYSVRFVTNRGRQLVIGHPGNEKRYPALEEDGLILAGCFGYWDKRDTVKATLQGVGGLYFHSYHVPSSGHEAILDSDNHHWCPERLPSGLEETGALWGSHTADDKRTYRQKTYPASNSTVSWLDCRAPLQCVKVTLCHGTSVEQIPLVAMTFEYVQTAQDNALKEMSFGPTVFSKPQDTEGSNGHHWCWCAVGYRRSEELQIGPHHRHEKWQVDEHRLRSLRIWLAEDKTLAGLQFVAANQAESPVWGYCDGKAGFSAIINFMTDQPADEAEARAKGDIAVGIKLFIGDNERQVSRNDSVVVGVQQIVQS